MNVSSKASPSNELYCDVLNHLRENIQRDSVRRHILHREQWSVLVSPTKPSLTTEHSRQLLHKNDNHI